MKKMLMKKIFFLGIFIFCNAKCPSIWAILELSSVQNFQSSNIKKNIKKHKKHKKNRGVSPLNWKKKISEFKHENS